MPKIVFIRHGNSILSQEKRFNGWDDIPLDNNAKIQLTTLGSKLLNDLYKFDVLITSYLQRSIISGWEVIESMNLIWIDEIRDWRLNPRHYGVLQGLTLEESIGLYGKDKIDKIQNDFFEKPPLLNESDQRNPKNSYRYSKCTDLDTLGESIEDVKKRIVAFFQEICVPLLEDDKKILISIHEDTFRVFMQYINDLSPEDTINEHIEFGVPVVLEYNKNTNKIEKRLI